MTSYCYLYLFSCARKIHCVSKVQFCLVNSAKKHHQITANWSRNGSRSSLGCGIMRNLVHARLHSNKNRCIKTDLSFFAVYTMLFKQVSRWPFHRRLQAIRPGKEYVSLCHPRTSSLYHIHPRYDICLHGWIRSQFILPTMLLFLFV